MHRVRHQKSIPGLYSFHSAALHDVKTTVCSKWSTGHISINLKPAGCELQQLI